MNETIAENAALNPETENKVSNPDTGILSENEALNPETENKVLNHKEIIAENEILTMIQSENEILIMIQSETEILIMIQSKNIALNHKEIQILNHDKTISETETPTLQQETPKDKNQMKSMKNLNRIFPIPL